MLSWSAPVSTPWWTKEEGKRRQIILNTDIWCQKPRGTCQKSQPGRITMCIFKHNKEWNISVFGGKVLFCNQSARCSLSIFVREHFSRAGLFFFFLSFGWRLHFEKSVWVVDGKFTRRISWPWRKVYCVLLEKRLFFSLLSDFDLFLQPRKCGF